MMQTIASDSLVNDWDSFVERCRKKIDEGKDRDRENTIKTAWELGDIIQLENPDKKYGEYSIDKLSDAIGRSKSTLYNALKIRQTYPEVSNALESLGGKSLRDANKLLIENPRGVVEIEGPKDPAIVIPPELSNCKYRLSQGVVKAFEEIEDPYMRKSIAESIENMNDPINTAIHAKIGQIKAMQDLEKKDKELDPVCKENVELKAKVEEWEKKWSGRLMDVEIQKEVIPENVGIGLKAISDDRDFYLKEFERISELYAAVFKKKEEMEKTLSLLDVRLNRKHAASEMIDVLHSQLKDAKHVTILDLMNVMEARK